MRQPSIDYTVSLRLVNEAGESVAQRDAMPVGTLLPPTTWAEGDEKPGYMALQQPPELGPGKYTLQVQVYDPTTVTPVAGIDQKLDLFNSPRSLASVLAADEVTVEHIH